jgi:MurNAc alpha-1-phosphate uridylyltransferase
MRAMILAAGRGARMRELSVSIPKPLLKIKNQLLIEYNLLALKRAGVKEIIINICHHAELIQTTLGDGSRYGVKIIYSVENQALETGGGIFQALPLLGCAPFIVVSADIITDYPYINLLPRHTDAAHLILVDNPEFKKEGDFGLCQGYLQLDAETRFTYANIGIFHPRLFNHCSPGKFPLAQILKPAIARQEISGEYFSGKWFNIGTPQQLYRLQILPLPL